ncbi:MAG: hypothetical protein Q9208_008285 [Pyrenodesmia sp. 3 TL-2023]
MEVVGLIANIGQLIEITAKTIRYLNRVKDASKDRLKVTREASSLIPLLLDLQSHVDGNKNEEWSRCVGALDGPLDQLREALEQLAKKLKPKMGLQDAFRAFVWTLDKAYTQEILGKIERVKSRVSLALQGDIIRGAHRFYWPYLSCSAHWRTAGRLRSDLGDLTPELINGSKLAQAIKADTAIIAGIDERISAITSDIGKLKTDEGRKATQLIDQISGSQADWAGAGKSILASMVINFLRARFTKQEPVGVAAVYCNFKERNSQSPENLLAGCCAQLVRQTLPQTLVSVHRIRIEEKTRPTWKEVVQIFEDSVTRLDIAYLVVDALDEGSEDVRNVVLPYLTALPSNVRLLVTTRHIDWISHEFGTSPMVKIRANIGDLRTYVTSRIRSNRRLSSHVRGNASLERDICEKVAFNADGMFLAAKLHVDALSTKTNIKQLKKALDNLSTNINDLYNDVLSRIESQNTDDRTLAEKALRWVAFTYRPLTAEALQEAVAIELGEQDFDAEGVPSIGSILDACAGLLIHDEENDIVRLVHYTAQDYFDGQAQSRLDEAHTCIARECITYMSYGCFQDPDGSRDNSRTYKLFWYACTFWAQHAMTRQDTAINEEVHQFLKRGPRVHLQTTSAYDGRVTSLKPKYLGFLRVRHGCEIAAFFGLHDELEMFCEEIKKVEALQHLPEDCFHLAASNNQIRSLIIALNYGADIDSKDTDGHSVLDTASAAGNLKLVNVLLARGSDTEVKCPGKTALLQAAWHSHGDCVLALLDHGANVNHESLWKRKALHFASMKGNLDIVKILLARGSDCDAQDRKGETPLFMAAESAHEDCVLALLNHGANVNTHNNHGFTPLHAASAKGSLMMVAELAKHSATINMRSEAMFSAKISRPFARTLRNDVTALKFEVDETVSQSLKGFPADGDPSHLASILRFAKDYTLEVLVWLNSVTALDIAMLREHNDIIQFLEPLTSSAGDSVPVSLEVYLLDLLGVDSMDKARKELERRMAEEVRKEKARQEESRQEEAAGIT